MKLYWNHIERGIELGRLTIVLHSDWFVERPVIDRDETDMWIVHLGFLSIGWELALNSSAKPERLARQPKQVDGTTRETRETRNSPGERSSGAAPLSKEEHLNA